LLVTLSLGCAKKDAPAESTTTFGNSTVVTGTLSSSPASLSGTGVAVFNAPLSGLKSKNSYALAFALTDGGSVTLQANSTNRAANGLAIRFSRSGETLSVKMIAGGAETDVSSKFTGIKASDALSFQIDVHNDETPAHVLVWTGADFSEDAALLNSESAGFEAPGNGNGSFWGLELMGATVTSAKVGAPKFKEN
jgi:hypothetical protein